MNITDGNLICDVLELAWGLNSSSKTQCYEKILDKS
ncbi:Uncharacterised protein [Yersinia kristensenii]|nr:Uncharacterised protein [Yersinia kristensenii]